MITIKISELGNNMIGFYIFNEANQLVHNFRRSKNDKKKHIERIRRIYMRKGLSVFCNDLTIN